MRHVHYGLTIVLATAFLSGCANPRKQPSVRPDPQEMPQFGFSPVSKGIAWRIGDRVVFEVTIFDGEEELRSYVTCEVAPQPQDNDWPKNLPREDRCNCKYSLSSGEKRNVLLPWESVYVKLEHRDAGFRVLETTDFVLPMQVFEKGSYDALHAVQGIDAESPESLPDEKLAEVWKECCAITATIAVYNELLARPGIRDLTNLIVSEGIKPNLFLVIPLGYAFSAKLGDDIEPVSTEALGLPDGLEGAYSYDLTGLIVTLFGAKPVATLTLTVVPPLPPFHVSGGVVLVEGKPLKKSDRWFRIRLVSARRGVGAVVRRADDSAVEKAEPAPS